MPGQSPAYNQRAEDGTGLGLRLEGEQVAPLGGCRESSPFFGVSFNPPPKPTLGNLWSHLMDWVAGWSSVDHCWDEPRIWSCQGPSLVALSYI